MPTLLEQSHEGLEFLSAVEDLSLDKEVSPDEPLFSEVSSLEKIHIWHEDQPSEAEMCAAMSETTWSTLYPDLRSLASYLVHTSPLPYWRGQEDDLAEDIVQETVRRVIERAQKSERGEASPILSLKQMATTVAYNYYRDLKRHDFRLSRLDMADVGMYTAHVYPIDAYSDEYVLDTVVDKVDQERLFDMLAGEIGRFPPKQKQAILTDLANRMYFDEEEPTVLQESFLDVGIELRDYHLPLPTDHKERTRHISLSSQAYKRVTRLPYA